MSLSPSEEALVRDLIAQNAALLSLASSESTIISKLGATKTTLTALTAASSLADSDLMLVRQGVTDKSVTGALVKAFAATPLDGSIQGAFKNLKISTTGTSAPVTVTADAVVVANGSAYKTITSVSLSPSLASAGANGLDAGTSAINTWYSVWVIWNGTTAAGLLSLSGTDPTMPATYTHKARVGWIRTDSTGNKYPLGFTAAGRRSAFKVASGSNVTTPSVMASATSATFLTSVAVAAFVPPSATAIDVGISCNNLALGGAVVAAPNNSYATSSPFDAPLLMGNGDSNGVALSLRTLMAVESTNIYWGASTGTADPAKLVCYGWEDNL